MTVIGIIMLLFITISVLYVLIRISAFTGSLLAEDRVRDALIVTGLGLLLLVGYTVYAFWQISVIV